jgi:hypothetical protein
MTTDTTTNPPSSEPVPDPRHGFTDPVADDLAKEAAERLDKVITRAEDLQRQVADQAWGPAGPPQIHKLAAVAGIAQTTLIRLSDGNIEAVADRVRAGVPPPKAPGYVGWHRERRGQRWRAVVQGDTEDAVFGALLVAVQGGDKLLTESGDDPNLRPKPR